MTPGSWHHGILKLALGILAGYFLFHGELYAEKAHPSGSEISSLPPPGHFIEMKMGNPKATVHVISYMSFGCPHCIDFFQKTFPDLKKKFIDQDKVYWIIRPYPADAFSLAMVNILSRCKDSEKNDIFNTVMEKKWDDLSSLKNALLTISNQKGHVLSPDDVNRCFSLETIKKSIPYAKDTAEKVGLKAVPTFFVNGTLIDGHLDEKRLNAFVHNPPPKKSTDDSVLDDLNKVFPKK